MKSQSVILAEGDKADTNLIWIGIDVSKDNLDVYDLASQTLSTFRGINLSREKLYV